MYRTEGSRIQVDGFGFLPGDHCQIVKRYTMTNKNKAIVRLLSLGACIQSIAVPNKNNDLVDVILGFDDVSGYLKNRYIGRIINRAANPFAKKKDQQIVDLGDNDIVNWDSCVTSDDRVASDIHVMSRVTRTKDNGHLIIEVSFTWSDKNRLHLEIRATSTVALTEIDLGSYCLFNLAGHGMGAKELKKHVVTINAEKQLELDVIKETVTGRIENCREKINKPTKLTDKQLYKVSGGGYNHHFCINNPSGIYWIYRFHARMLYPSSGQILEVYSNHPFLQFYTGNNFPNDNTREEEEKENQDEKKYEKEIIIGKGGATYTRHGCFALVPQGYPFEMSSTSRGKFLVLSPHKIYLHDITYDFGCK